MRSNVVYSFAAVFAAFALFAAVFVAFALPVPATAEQSTGAMATIPLTQKQGVPEVLEVIVESHRAI
jgi:hypothetical protein